MKVIEKGQMTKARVNSKHIEREDYAKLVEMEVHTNAKVRLKRVDKAYLEYEARSWVQ